MRIREKMYELFIEYNSHYAVICDSCFSDTPEEHESKIYGLIDHLIANGVTIEAEPVRHGRWEWGLNSMNQYGAWCSECKCGWEDKGDDFDRIQGLVIAHKYCPNCGATMDGGSDE